MSLFKQMYCSLKHTWISKLVCRPCNTGSHHNVFIYLNVPFLQVCIKCKLTNMALKSDGKNPTLSDSLLVNPFVSVLGHLLG